MKNIFKNSGLKLNFKKQEKAVAIKSKSKTSKKYRQINKETKKEKSEKKKKFSFIIIQYLFVMFFAYLCACLFVC